MTSSGSQPSVSASKSHHASACKPYEECINTIHARIKRQGRQTVADVVELLTLAEAEKKSLSPRKDSFRLRIVNSAIWAYKELLRNERLKATGFLAILFLFLLPVLQAQVSLSGTMVYPDGTAFNGKLTLRYSKASVANACAGGQIVQNQPVTLNIVNGVIPALSLIASACQGTNRLTQPVTAITQRGAGLGANASTNGFDLQGTVVLHTGTNPTAGPIARVQFGQIYPGGQTPKCITTLNGVQYGLTTSATTLLLTFNSTTALQPNTSYSITYYCSTQPASVTAFNASNVQIYTGHWVVPNGTATWASQSQTWAASTGTWWQVGSATGTITDLDLGY